MDEEKYAEGDIMHIFIFISLVRFIDSNTSKC